MLSPLCCAGAAQEGSPTSQGSRCLTCAAWPCLADTEDSDSSSEASEGCDWSSEKALSLSAIASRCDSSPPFPPMRLLCQLRQVQVPPDADAHSTWTLGSLSLSLTLAHGCECLFFLCSASPTCHVLGCCMPVLIEASMRRRMISSLSSPARELVCKHANTLRWVLCCYPVFCCKLVEVGSKLPARCPVFF